MSSTIGQSTTAKLPFRIPLRLVLVIPFVVQLLAAVGLVGWLSWRNGRAAVNDVAAQLRREITARIDKQVSSVLSTHKLINRLNLEAFQEGYLNLDAPPESSSLRRYFWRQLRQFETAAYIYYASEEEHFFGANRTLADPSLHQQAGYTFSGEVTEYKPREYLLDDTGNLKQLIATYPTYSATTTFWYKKAVEAKKPTWTDIYSWNLGNNISIDTVTPVYDNGGKLKGVLGVCFTLNNISKFLETLDVGDGGQTFILERTGYLVATSTSETPFSVSKISESEEEKPSLEDIAPVEGNNAEFQFIRLKAILSQNDLTRAAAIFLNHKFDNLHNITTGQQLEFYLAGEKQFIQVTPLQDEAGIDWLIVVVIPEAEFMAQINAHNRITIWLCMTAAIVATGTGIITARWVTQPLLQLNRAAKDIARGEWHKPVEIYRHDEVGELANSFKTMAAQLQESFQNLEQRVAERTAELQEQRHFLRRVIDSNPNIIFVKEEKGRFVLANQALAKVYGTTVEALIGKTDADFNHHQEEVEHYWQSDREVMATGCPQILEETITTATGERRYLETIKIPLQTATPQLLGVGVDITDRKQFEEQLQQAKETADAANQAKSEFLAAMSHELRTPLNGILGYAQILQRASDLNPKHRHGIEIIEQAGSHLLALINDILDLAKIEARKMELFPKDFHLPSFLSGVAEITRIRAEKKGINFYYLPDPHLPAGVWADEKRLRQVLINLLGNAIKFTHEGSVTFKAQVLAPGEDPAKIRFIIADTGVGMTPEQLPKIFLPFEQVGDGSKRTEGTGLGLAICRQIVAMMGSEIQVSSTWGKGSTFWFEAEFPASRSWVSAATTGAKGKIIGYTGKERKILVVDDKDVNRLVVAEVLKSLGFVVAEAENGAGGLSQVAAVQPDLIITDIAMPVMDGYEFTEKVRLLYAEKIPIIAASASVSASDQAQAIARGCTEFLAKPVDLEQLLMMLQKHLQLAWVYDQPDGTETGANRELDVVFPPAAELKILHRAAIIGDIETVEIEAKRIQDLAPEYLAFAQRVLELAGEFDGEKIQNLVEIHIPNG
ncbi:ATP-binding protein [[Phormidium] sp. ETS-05]|uniref:ATP-binding protein n=1 Tax=[Phormidium] sp. ETS-05 TaxID=222819 RepID=UPI0018EF223F|nr:ATP-binding protein [[Phormidium] sp. ETS-05]